VHKDAFQESKKVLIIDDLLATGGTATAAFKLIPENLVTGFGFMVELSELNGRKKIEEISDARIESLVIYD
jgi:adenine phosphoribosyltransferase